jgi:Tfp pilus assembly protein PilN
LQRNVAIAQYSVQQSQEKYQQLSIYEDKFKQVNSLDKTLRKIQTGHLHWFNLFQQLSSTVPEGIYISGLSTKDYSIFLVGKAKTRDNLLNFKSKLEENECFQNINVPISNLVVENNVDFQIDFVIKNECLK